MQRVANPLTTELYRYTGGWMLEGMAGVAMFSACIILAVERTGLHGCGDGAGWVSAGFSALGNC